MKSEYLKNFEDISKAIGHLPWRESFVACIAYAMTIGYRELGTAKAIDLLMMIAGNFAENKEHFIKEDARYESGC